MNVKFWTISVVALGIFVCSGCSHDLSYGNPDESGKEFARNFETTIGEVNPNQDWNLFSNRSVSVEVGGDRGTTYTLYVCDKNPALDKSASLLAATTAQGSTTAKLPVSLATAIETVYVVRGDGQAQHVVPAQLIGNQYEGSFAYTPSASARTRATLASGNPFSVVNTDGYFAAVPATAVDLPANGLLADATDTDYKVSSGTYNPWPYYSTAVYSIYVTGDVTMSFTYTSGQNVNIYVVSGTLTITGDDSQNLTNGFISVAPGATLKWQRTATSVPSYTRLINTGGSFTIYNRGTLSIEGEKLGIADNATIYNEGTLIATKGIDVIGGTKTGYLYNVGEHATLSLGSLTASTNGHFLNDGGKVTVSGKTEAGDGNTWWVNNGHYTTGSLTIDQNNKNFYNYCQLFINNKLSVIGGGLTSAVFHQMDGSYLEAGSATFNNVTVEMGSEAGFNIKGNSLWKAKGSDFQGFRAGAGNAYVRLGGDTSIESHVRNFQATGNITLAINNLVDLGNDNEGDRPLTEYTNGATLTNFETLTVTPDATGCGAAWTVGGGIEPTYDYNTIAFEDLGSTDDFDFNDIVLETARDAKSGKTTITIVAAGGTLPVEVRYNGETLFSKTDGVMRTARGDYGHAEINMTSNDDLRKFSLAVTKANGLSSTIISSAAVKGEAPQALIIPGRWAWPTERTSITTAYPEFAEWVKDVANTDWYNHPTGKVVK